LSLAVCCPSGHPSLQLVEDMKLRGEELSFELQWQQLSIGFKFDVDRTWGWFCSTGF